MARCEIVVVKIDSSGFGRARRSGELDVAARRLAGAVSGEPASTDAATEAAFRSTLEGTAVPTRIAATLVDGAGLALLLVLIASVLALGAALATAALVQGDQARRRPESAR